MSLVLFLACAPLTSTPPVVTHYGAAFVDLDHVDIYSYPDGELLRTVGLDEDYSADLPAGDYYMDFVNTDGEHGFLPDGRMAFAPTGEGMTPVFGPLSISEAEAPVWQVKVDPVLEANAQLIHRLQANDPSLDTLRAELEFFPEFELPGPAKAYSTASGSATRLNLTWELSFAMGGDINNTKGYTCNSSTNCWSFGAGAGTVYGRWDVDSNGTGYVDYDTTAWNTARGVYTNGLTSCADNTASYKALGITCGVSVGSSNGKNYTCQSSTGACSGGTAGTKTHGGECKFFQNLVLYRSSVYGNRTTQTWKTLPTDSTIRNNLGTYPKATTASVAVGDVLRAVDNGYLHSTIVVAYDSATHSAFVVDSNWDGSTATTYNEYLGAHVLTYNTGSNSTSYWNNYRDLDCIYTGGC